MANTLNDYIKTLDALDFKNMYENNFFLTWEKTEDELKAVFADADVVYPKSWAPYAAMEVRTDLYGKGDFDGIDKLEQELLAQNAQHMDWHVTEDLMATTKNGQDAIYMHPLPADIEGVSCEHGEVAGSVFDAHRDSLYKEASFKPYIIAAMIFLAKCKDLQATFKALEAQAKARRFQA